MSRIRIEDKIEQYLNDQLNNLKKLGVKNPSRADALRFMIEQNKAVQLKIKRKRKHKFGFIFQ